MNNKKEKGKKQNDPFTWNRARRQSKKLDKRAFRERHQKRRKLENLIHPIHGFK
jgi:hypothetical protein